MSCWLPRTITIAEVQAGDVVYSVWNAGQCRALFLVRSVTREPDGGVRINSDKEGLWVYSGDGRDTLILHHRESEVAAFAEARALVDKAMSDAGIKQ